MVAHAYGPRTPEVEKEDSEFKASLEYMMMYTWNT